MVKANLRGEEESIKEDAGNGKEADNPATEEGTDEKTEEGDDEKAQPQENGSDA